MREKRAGDRHVTGQRMTGVILHPLAEVGIGVLMPIVISGRQLVMDLQRRGEWRHREQERHQEQCDCRADCDRRVTR